MREGSYTWPDGSNTIELRYDWEAIRWLLAQMPGASPGTMPNGAQVPMNATILESSEVDYYRAGGSRIASLTGLSGLRGMHVGEQRPGEQLGPRESLHREIWWTPDVGRMTQLLEELQIDLIYVGQLERLLHPDAVARFEALAAGGALRTLFQNEGTTIYGVN
jgi:uncharacterized membrane protein